MKYIKTPELWNMTKEQISKLQPGQWVKCGGRRARFAGLYGSAKTIWVTYFNGSVPMSQFRAMRSSCK